MAPSRFSSLRFTSVGVFLTFFEFLSGIPVVLSHSVALLLHYHATGASGIPVHQVPAILWSKDSSVCTAFLRQVYGILLLLTQAQI